MNQESKKSSMSVLDALTLIQGGCPRDLRNEAELTLVNEAKRIRERIDAERKPPEPLRVCEVHAYPAGVAVDDAWVVRMLFSDGRSHLQEMSRDRAQAIRKMWIAAGVSGCNKNGPY